MAMEQEQIEESEGIWIDEEMKILMMTMPTEQEFMDGFFFANEEQTNHNQQQSQVISETYPLKYNQSHNPNQVVIDPTQEEHGLQLVHLLLACAEAVACRDTQLAASVLTQIWPRVSPWGDSLQRVSLYFAYGLSSRLSNLFTLSTKLPHHIPKQHKTEAFSLLHQTTPYVKFGYSAANLAILEASQSKHLLHIIDIGTKHTLQWASLIRNIADSTNGSPKFLRITAIVEEQETEIEKIQMGLRGIAEEAASLGISMEFTVMVETATTPLALLITRETLILKSEETLFVNSILHLHKYVKENRGSLKSILQAIKKLEPLLFTVVEQDANHNGPFFLGRFLESLHYYSTIFDSLEAVMSRDCPKRLKIEETHFGEEIRNILGCEGSGRIERHERMDQWRRQLARAGFQAVGMKSLRHEEMMQSVHGCELEFEGFTVANEKGCLLLGWKGRPIMMASAWKVHNIS